MAGYSRDFSLLRIKRTHSCMKVIKDGTPSWEWAEKTVVAVKTDYDAILTQLETESDETADTTDARGTRDENLNQLMALTQLGAGSLRIKHRNSTAKLRLFAGLESNANAVQGKLAQALAFESAWQKGDPAYVLEDEDATTLAEFKTLRLLCVGNHENVSDEGAEETEASGEVKVQLQALYDLVVAWYALATLKYGPETTRGMLIRGFIPTEPASGGTVPEQAVITAEAGIGQATLTVVATGATRYTILYRPLGTTEWLEVVVGHESGSFTHTGLTPGNYEYLAIGHNNAGDGPESEVVAVEVT